MKRTLLVCSVALLGLASCNIKSVKGDGNVTSKNYAGKGFRDIEASSDLEVHLVQGPDYDVKVEAEKNILEYIEVAVVGDVLKIGQKNNTSISPGKPIKVYVTAPEFRNLELSGACSLLSDGKISSGTEVKIGMSGACETNMEIEAPKIDVDASGATEIKLRGRAATFEVDASGSSTINCFDLLTENANIEISGGGDAEVSVSKSLTVDISGAGSVRYKGNPVIKQDVSGAGSVNKAD
jgi:hypothetical protein